MTSGIPRTVRARERGAGAHAGQNYEPAKRTIGGHHMTNGWTPERRARQAELIKTWKPWKQSTGPLSSEGRAKVAKNAYKGGHRLMLRELSRMVNAEIREARELGLRMTAL